MRATEQRPHLSMGFGKQHCYDMAVLVCGNNVVAKCWIGRELKPLPIVMGVRECIQNSVKTFHFRLQIHKWTDSIKIERRFHSKIISSKSSSLSGHTSPCIIPCTYT